jgi:acyl-CoA synthetase (AMP-forming)/AMP-acid ligase II
VVRSTPQRIEQCMRLDWWSGRTVDELLREAVTLAAEREALVDPPNRASLVGGRQQRLTWCEVDAHVDEFAAVLATLGLECGDVLAAQLPNTVETVIGFLACARLGLIFCPLSMQFRAHELRYMIGKARARAFLTVRRFKDSDSTAALAELRGELPALHHVLTIGEGDAIDLMMDGAPARRDFTVLRERLARTQLDPNDLLTICWTSGTEARPKGVPRSHNHWIANGEACSEIGEVQTEDSVLNPFPMINTASIGGMVMPWLMQRARLVQHHPFDLAIFLQQLETERINYTVAPPAVLTQLLKNEELLARIDLSALRSVGSGSAPLASWMVEGWQRRFGIAIANIFGSNEGCALFSTARDLPDPNDRAQFFPRFGAPGVQWSSRFSRKVRTRLVDMETDEEITTAGRPGELRIDGPFRFDGYWDEPQLNAAAFDELGFFRTGDLFEIAGEGERARYYRFVGRSKEVIVRGGMKLSPAELDVLVEGHPQLREAAFFGVPDEVLGERVAVAVALRPGENVTLENIVDWLRKRDLAVIKLPERLLILDALPRNSLGKVVRRALPQLYFAAQRR